MGAHARTRGRHRLAVLGFNTQRVSKYHHRVKNAHAGTQARTGTHAHDTLYCHISSHMHAHVSAHACTRTHAREQNEYVLVVNHDVQNR